MDVHVEVIANVVICMTFKSRIIYLMKTQCQFWNVIFIQKTLSSNSCKDLFNFIAFEYSIVFCGWYICTSFYFSIFILLSSIPPQFLKHFLSSINRF